MATNAVQTIHQRAPAKLNLTLAVLGRRSDGYHELESWVVTIGWFDQLVFRSADELSLHVRNADAASDCILQSGKHRHRGNADTGETPVPQRDREDGKIGSPNAAVASPPRDRRQPQENSQQFSILAAQESGNTPILADESNLVWQAAVKLAGAVGRKPAAHIELEKHIAIGAGLGGGSSDAAATLNGLNTLWKLNWSVNRLMPVAASLGSDVPLFLDPGPAVIRGRGERVERFSASWQGWVALVVPPFGVSTADVYRRWRPTNVAPARRAPAWAQPCSDAMALSEKLFNDLTDASFACEPRLAQLHATLDRLNGRRVHLTGSGSCLFALFDEENEAENWKRRASTAAGNGVHVRVVPTT